MFSTEEKKIAYEFWEELLKNGLQDAFDKAPSYNQESRDYFDCENGFVYDRWDKDLNDLLSAPANWLYNNEGYLNAEYNVSRGETRFVIYNDICEEYGIVLKVNLRPDGKKYQEKEVEIYKAAEEADCEECFIEVEHLCNYKDFVVNIVKWCYCDDDVVSDRSSEVLYEYRQDYYEDYEDFLDNYCCDDDDLLDYAETEWGNILSSRVYKIIRDFGINDLHSGNWGYYKNSLVLTDYSGY